MESIPLMKAGCTLFCMAHFHSFPKRAALLEKHRINVIAMEEVLESPKVQTDAQILARLAMSEALQPFIAAEKMHELDVVILGRNDILAGALRRAGNRNPRSLSLLQDDMDIKELKTRVSSLGKESLFFYDSADVNPQKEVLLDELKAAGVALFDFRHFEKAEGAAAVQAYRDAHEEFEYGLRRIQCLHITGQAGARYGLKLLRENKKNLVISDAKVVVVGYGNVARGAMHELYDQGVRQVQVLGRIHTAKDQVEKWLQGADLIVNGAEQPSPLRGVNFLVENAHLEHLLADGSVVIDLVGGSASNRSPVEAVIDCTFLTDPSFVKHGVTISALWGWPMLGMMAESAIRYSSQILDVLRGQEQLLRGLDHLSPGVKCALVCGPFSAESS